MGFLNWFAYISPLLGGLSWGQIFDHIRPQRSSLQSRTRPWPVLGYNCEGELQQKNQKSRSWERKWPKWVKNWLRLGCSSFEKSSRLFWISVFFCSWPTRSQGLASRWKTAQLGRVSPFRNNSGKLCTKADFRKTAYDASLTTHPASGAC